MTNKEIEMNDENDEIEILHKAIIALEELSIEGREYLLDRFWNDAEISAEQRRRMIRRAAQQNKKTEN